MIAGKYNHSLKSAFPNPLVWLVCKLLFPSMLLAQPVIISFAPLSANPGDDVTITGTGFNTSSVDNIVSFGATRGTVTTASATSLTVTVPGGATYSPISVLNTGTGLSCASLRYFNPIFTPAKAGGIGSGEFNPRYPYATEQRPYSVALGDLDLDGKPEMVVANNASNLISIYRNNTTGRFFGLGSFAFRQNFSTGLNPSSVAIGDVDGDGLLDLVVANTGSGTVSVFRNTSSSFMSFAVKVDFPTGPISGQCSVAIGDLDLDGKPDLAVANSTGQTISVLRNTSTRGVINSLSFATKVDFSAAGNPYSIAIGDLDGDGMPDMALANYTSNNVSVFRNTYSGGSISFAGKVDYDIGTPFGNSVVIGDLDGDGKSDLAVANGGATSISVLRNTSTSGSLTTGSFAPKVDFTTAGAPRGLAIGDLHGDGKPDLAATASSYVSVIRNLSTSGSITSGSFAPKTDFQAAGIAASIAIGDMNSDGRPDMAVANGDMANSVSVFGNAECLSPTLGGTIAGAQAGTAPFDPTAFISIEETDGYFGTLVYQWQSSVTSSTSGFSDISGANSDTYDPGPLSVTTWFKRRARVTCTGDWTGAVESNVLEVTVSPPIFTWNGSSGNDWNTAANWTPNAVPHSASSIVIPTGLANYPVIPATLTQVAMTLQGGNLTLGSSVITLAGGLTNNGSITGTGKLVFAGTSAQTITGTGTISNLEVNNSAGVTITSGAGNLLSLTGTLTPTSGTLTTNGNLTLKSSASGTARVAAGSSSGGFVSGNVTVERYIPAGRKWRFLCAPLTGSSNNSVFYNWQNNDVPNGSTGVEIWGPGGHADPSSSNTGLALGASASMRSYGSSGWQNVTNTNTTLLYDNTTNYGYALFQTGPYNNGSTAYIGSSGSLPAGVATTLSATGSLITGDHVKSLTATSAGQYFLVANPYASPVNPASFTDAGTVNRTNLDNTLYMWDAKQGGTNSLGRYVSFSISGGAYSNGGAGTGFADNTVQIQSGQAFFVRASSPGAATLVFRESSKSATGAHDMFGSATQAARKAVRLFLQQDSSHVDGAVAFFRPGASAGIDSEDGVKLINASDNLGLRREGRTLVFEFRPEIKANDTLFTTLTQMQQRSFRLRVALQGFTADDGIKAELVDRQFNRRTSLSLTDTTDLDFSVTADSASSGGRFLIVFTKSASTGGGTAEPGEIAKMNPYPNPVVPGMPVRVDLDAHRAPWDMQLMDATGRLVWRKTVNDVSETQVRIDMSRMGAGVYQLMMTDAKGERVVSRVVKH